MPMDMRKPEAVRKHDGRIVAFNPLRLMRSVTRAALASGKHTNSTEAKGFGEEITRAVCSFLVNEYPPTPTTGDVRELTQRLLRETGHVAVADAYTDHARQASSLLWRMRLIDAGPAEGAPWDRRRLIESLRSSGVASDPAGEMARHVERRLVQLGAERINAALVHALALLALHERGMDARRYAARRVSANFAPLSERYVPAVAAECPLPNAGPALEAFWLQAVHSDEVNQAVRGNLLSLEPYPASPAEAPRPDAWADPLDAAARERWSLQAGRFEADLRVRADGGERIGAFAEALAAFSRAEGYARGTEVPEFRAGVTLSLRGAPEVFARPQVSAFPITLNLGGLLVREAIHDPQKATLRLTQLVTLAAQAHREREEYFGLAPMRGRKLPLAPAGLWNAAAWLAREPYMQHGPAPVLRAGAGALLAALNAVVSTLRQETGLQLVLRSDGPRAAAAALWRRDCAFLEQDGVSLDPASAYEIGLDLRLTPGLTDLGERLDFLRAHAAHFDEPPPLSLKAPLGREPDASAWRELLEALRATGLPRARLLPGGSARGVRLLARHIREHLQGYPLFENRS